MHWALTFLVALAPACADLVMKSALAVVGLLASVLTAQAAPYPCDMPPGPAQLCYGMKRMKAAFTGPAVTVFNPANSHSANIGFSGTTDEFDGASLGSLLAGSTGIVTRWWEQANGPNLDQITVAQSPNISSFSIGNTPALILRGGGVLGNPSGLQTANFGGSSFGITARDYTIYAVVKPATSIATNQAVTPGLDRAALLELAAASPVTQNASLTFSSSTLTDLSDTTNIAIGDAVAVGGVAIDRDTQIVLVNNPTTITLNKPALSSGTFLTLYFRTTQPGAQALNETTFTAGSTTATMLRTNRLALGDNVISWGAALNYTNVAGKTASTVTINNPSTVTGVSPVTFSRPIVRVYNNANNGIRGTWSVDDSTPNFDFTAPASVVPTNPTVVAITSSAAEGVRIYQDGYTIGTASLSPSTATAQVLTLGRLASSPAGQFSRSFEGPIVALMVYNTGHKPADVGFITAALQEHYRIDPSVATHKTNQVMLTSDSIGAGYQTVGTFGYLDYLQALVTKRARFMNFSVAGSSLTQDPRVSPNTFSATALFPIAMAPHLSAENAVKGRVFIIHGGGNDAGMGAGAKRGTSTIGNNVILMADTSNINVGDFIGSFDNTLATFATVTAINPGVSVTASVNATISGTTRFYFTLASRNPTFIYNSLQTLTDNAIAAGATKVIVSTILPRNDGWRQWRNSVNALILGGITGATVVDCASQPGLNTNPGPSYQDSAHPNALGHRQMAVCLSSTVNSGLQ
jgi:hypothetical protein